jgi:hypothetical protein
LANKKLQPQATVYAAAADNQNVRSDFICMPSLVKY